MSRSNPQERIPNPSTRWWDWNGQDGRLSYWDKTEEKRLTEPLPFTFLLLDEVSTVKGWDDKSDSKIFSNEVRDIGRDSLVVRSYTGGVLFDGRYNKAAIEALGGAFHASCYLAYKTVAGYALGNLSLHGAAVGAWMEFQKTTAKQQSPTAIYEKAISLTGYAEDKKGSITFRVPTFTLVPVSSEAQNAALALDKDLQAYLTSYLKRPMGEQVAVMEPAVVTADSIPF